MTEFVTRVAHLARWATASLDHSEELTWEDEEQLAREYDAARGFDRPKEEQSKRLYALTESVPRMRWTPPALRLPR